MGCGNSKETQNFDENQNLAETQRESTQPAKVDGANLDPKIDSPSPIELVQEDQHFRGQNNEHQSDMKVVITNKAKQKKRLSIDSGTASDAWTTGKINIVSDDQVKELTHNIGSDSEFGREGIDHFSSSFGDTGKNYHTTQLVSRGIPTEIEHDGRMPRLTKKFSEEPFDPSSLIDVDKFKAVNTQNQVESKDTSGTVTMETRTTAMQSGPTTVISPSNYHDFYDEDEKALMKSIEQDFTETGYSTLPGVVV